MYRVRQHWYAGQGAVRSWQPPLRLALGSDTVARVRAKNVSVEGELQAWMHLSLSTDQDAPARAT